MKPFQDISDPALAKALAHPLRTRILAALDQLGGTVGDAPARDRPRQHLNGLNRCSPRDLGIPSNRVQT